MHHLAVQAMTNMGNIEEPTYQIYDDPMDFYPAMLKDIDHAKHFVYIETYRFGNDSIGKKFREALTRKAKEGVEVKLLIDSWGSLVNQSFFTDLIKFGGDVRFFKKIFYSFDFFYLYTRLINALLICFKKKYIR